MNVHVLRYDSIYRMFLQFEKKFFFFFLQMQKVLLFVVLNSSENKRKCFKSKLQNYFLWTMGTATFCPKENLSNRNILANTHLATKDLPSKT